MTTARLEDMDAVIFDMDGVVTETATVHAASWKKLFDAYLKEQAEKKREEFVPFDIKGDYERYVDGKNRYDGVRSFLASRGLKLPEGDPSDSGDEETVHGLGNRKDAFFHKKVQEDGVKSFESTIELIRRLKSQGKRIGIVTASRNAEGVLKGAGVRDLFEEKVDGMVAAEMGLKGKPDGATFVEAAKRLGVEPTRAAVVEDALAGVQAGRNGGFGLVVGVARGGQHEALKEAGADVVVSDLGELLA